MNLARLTFSNAALVRAGCAWWMRSDAAWRDDESEYSEGGSVVHALLAAVVNGELVDLAADATLRAMYARAHAWLVARWTRPGSTRFVVGLRAEVAFAYDVATGDGRELVDPPGEEPRWYADPGKRSKYGVKDTEICGRLDLTCMGVDDQGSFACIDDYKFHFGPEVIDARDQLEIAALAVSRAWGVERVKAMACHVWADRDVLEEPYEFTPYDLEEIAAWVDALAEAGESPEAREGPHCRERHCSARASCPVTAIIVDEVLASVPAERLAKGRSFVRPTESDEHGEWKLVAADLLEEAVKAQRADVRGYADARDGFPLSNGKIYGAQEQTEEKPDLSAPGAVEILEELGLDFAIATSTTWTAIEEVGGKDKAKEVRARLRAIDAIKSSRRTVYAARAPKKRPGAGETRRAS